MSSVSLTHKKNKKYFIEGKIQNIHFALTKDGEEIPINPTLTPEKGFDNICKSDIIKNRGFIDWVIENNQPYSDYKIQVENYSSIAQHVINKYEGFRWSEPIINNFLVNEKQPYLKNKRITLITGLSIFAVFGFLILPFPINLMPLAGIPMIIEQIHKLKK